MAQIPNEKLLENIISKLKENATDWENAKLPVDKKIDHLIQIMHDTIGKNGTEQDMKGVLVLILNGLENIRDYYTYNMNTVTKNYNTYLYVLEALYNEYSKSAGEPAKVAKELHIERELPSETPAPQLQSHQMSKELVMVTDEKPKAKSELFKFP